MVSDLITFCVDMYCCESRMGQHRSSDDVTGEAHMWCHLWDDDISVGRIAVALYIDA